MASTDTGDRYSHRKERGQRLVASTDTLEAGILVVPVGRNTRDLCHLLTPETSIVTIGRGDRDSWLLLTLETGIVTVVRY